MTIRMLSHAGPWTWPATRSAETALLVYKHSPVCGASTAARAEVLAFHAAAPELPIYQVDVLAQRSISRMIADDLMIEHESPQAILLCSGVPVWHTSHFRITAATLLGQVQLLPARCGSADLRTPAKAG